MASQAKPRLAYRFFQERLNSNTLFTAADLMAVTGWTASTAKTYLGKQWREFIDRRGGGELWVRPDFQRLTENAFLQLATQNRRVFTSYRRVKYREIVTYEFLLPLTREDQLRKALDSLFYEDTIRQRLAEIGLKGLRTWLPPRDDEPDEAYVARVCAFVSDRFGGYSITHVSGRYRAAALADRAHAGQMLAADARYIIDETTASVRFIIPIDATKDEDPATIDELRVGDVELAAAAMEEMTVIHLLFFGLFVEAVVRMVNGEDEIWLVEETGRSHSLYAWRREERQRNTRGSHAS